MTATSLGDVIDRARRQSFVGRRVELRTFDDALAGRSPRRLLFVHGPGGIGKTTLLHEMRARGRAAGRTTVLLDGREIDPSPDGFTSAVDAAGSGTVLLIDGYEQLGALDGWLRRDLVPALSAEHVVVLAGREPPAAAWRADPGWRQVVAIHPLDHLDDVDSADLLARAGVAAPDRPRLVALGRGHPLALALLADVAQGGTVPDSLADVPDLISALLESLLRDAPSEAHMVGLARFVVDGQPVATGVVAVGDAWACTNPSVGRGASIALVHARLLRDLLRETDPADHDKFARRFDEVTGQSAEPLYRATLWYDRHRLAEIDADAAGIPYRTEDQRWPVLKALVAASLTDPDLVRAYTSIAGFVATAEEVFGVPGVVDRAVALGMAAPQYPLPGPTRGELLESLGR